MREVHPQGSSSRLQVPNRTGQVSAAKSLGSPSLVVTGAFSSSSSTASWLQ